MINIPNDVPELLEGIIDDARCICLLHKDAASGKAKLQICTGNKELIRLMVEMTGANKEAEEDSMELFSGEVTLVLCLDK